MPLVLFFRREVSSVGKNMSAELRKEGEEEVYLTRARHLIKFSLYPGSFSHRNVGRVFFYGPSGQFRAGRIYLPCCKSKGGKADWLFLLYSEDRRRNSVNSPCLNLSGSLISTKSEQRTRAHCCSLFSLVNEGKSFEEKTFFSDAARAVIFEITQREKGQKKTED